MCRKKIVFWTSLLMIVVLMTVVLMAGKSGYVLASEEKTNGSVTDSRWKIDGIQTKGEETSKNILVDIKYEYDEVNWRHNYYFTYVIPENYNDNKISINVISDLEKFYDEGTYVPGDGENFYVSIINKSDKKYIYNKGSLKITDGNYTGLEDADRTFTYNNSDGAYVKDAITFTNRPISAESTVWRTSNSALKELLGIKDSSSEHYSNDKISEALISNGYENGLDDLDKYYLDYMNEKYNTCNKKLEDFDVKQICDSIFNGVCFNPREANSGIAQLGYNMYYNNLLMLTMDDIKAGNDDCLAGHYSVGSWMRGENNADEYMEGKTGILQSGMKESKNIMNVHICINGPYTTNPYQGTMWGLGLQFSLVVYNEIKESEPETPTQKSTEKKTISDTSSEEEYVTIPSDVISSTCSDVWHEVAADEESVKTGDSKKIYVYIFMGGISIATITLICIYEWGKNGLSIKKKK